MQHQLNDNDVDKMITEIRDSSHSEMGILHVYKSTSTTGKVSFVVEAKSFGTLTLERDTKGIYHFADIQLEEDDATSKSHFYLLFNGMVRLHTGKEWLANNPMNRPDSSSTLQ